MSTALGGGSGGGTTIAVLNAHASVTIAKGRAVSWLESGTLVELGANSQPTFMPPIGPMNGTNFAGITVAAIAPGKVGILITQGPVMCETTGPVVDGVVLEVATVGGNAAAGVLQAYAAGDRVGFALQDEIAEATGDFIPDSATAPTYALCAVDSATSQTAAFIN